MEIQKNMEVVVVICQQKLESKVIQAIEEAGAGGATLMYGKGRGVRNMMGNWGLLIQPEKVMVFSVVSEEITQAVIDAAKKAAGMDSPGNGLAFSTKINNLVGLFP